MAVKYVLVGFCFCLLLNLGSPQVPENDATTQAPETTTTVKPPETTTPTTVPTTTTKVPPTPNTTTPATTTSTSTTPTTTSTTPTTTPTSTTPSTTTPPPTTTSPITTTAPPAPKPLPDPEEGSWVLNSTTSNITCAVINMALRMKIPYSVENKTEWGMLNLPKNANISGACDNTTIKNNITSVKLLWNNNTDFLEITFSRDLEKKTFNVTKLLLNQTTSGEAFPNSTVNKPMIFTSNGSGLFYMEFVPLGNSYKCSHKVNLNLTSEENATLPSAMLVFSKVQIQAFMNSTAPGFGTVMECPGLDASDIVPIAVGCALAGLVIGVLIAYLVGRRRSHARGYLSM